MSVPGSCRLLLVLGIVLGACQDPPRPRTAEDLLCGSGVEPVAYGDFYWDEVRRSDRPSFDRAYEICSRRCPRTAPCGPVLSVARWYDASFEGFEPIEAFDVEPDPGGAPDPGGSPGGEPPEGGPR